MLPRFNRLSRTLARQVNNHAKHRVSTSVFWPSIDDGHFRGFSVKNKLLFGLVCLAVFGLGPSYASDLGRYGNAYNIAEKDGEDQLRDAVQSKLSNGGQEKLLAGAQSRTYEYFNNLPPLPNIKPASKNNIRLENLTVVVNQDIRDTKGQIVVAAGTKINPLVIKPLTKKVYFIDGRDQKQLELVKQTAGPRDSIILTAGSIFKVQDYLQRSVFIDQNPAGVLSTRMRIHVAPSIASQSGANLKIEELKL